MTESEMSYCLVQVIVTIYRVDTTLNIMSTTCNKVRQQQQQQLYRPGPCHSQLTQDCKQLQHLNSLTSCLTIQCILLENVSIKTKNHSVSKDFQRFLDSAVIELDVLNDLIFDLSCFMCHVFSQVNSTDPDRPQDVCRRRIRMSRSTNHECQEKSATLKHSRHLL